MKLNEIVKHEHTGRSPAGIAYEQAMKVGRRYPVGEHLIAKSPSFALKYADEVLKKRFPMGEVAIAASAQHSVDYARYVIRGRFPEGEKAIEAHPRYEKIYKQFLKSLG